MFPMNQPPMQPTQQPMQPGMAGGQLDPSLVQAILGMQQQQAQRNGMQRQLALAQQLRADASGQLQGQQAGRIYKAPGLANLAAGVLANYKAKGLVDDVGVREQNMGVQTTDAMRQYFDAMTGRRKQPMPHMGDEGE
jgi:hypothetical protein